VGKQEEIRKALADHAMKFGPAATMLATVVAVDPSTFTCTLVDADDDFEYPGIRLRPVLDGNEALTLFPKVGTWALAVRIEDEEHEWMVMAMGEVDKWRLKIGATIIEQDATGLLVQKGSDTLKQVLTLIIEAMQKIIVLQGTNPDRAKLVTAKTKTNNLFR